MPTVYYCIVNQHSSAALGLAALLCISCATNGLLLMRHALRGGSLGWAITAGAVSGFGMWATHFVAMLGYLPVTGMGYRLLPTLGSLLIACSSTTAAFLIARQGRDAYRPLAAAALMGGGVAAMHYAGVIGLDGPVALHFAPLYVALSLLVPLAPLMLAFGLVHQGEAIWRACLLMSGAVLGLHILGMTALRLTPARRAPYDGLLISGHAMTLVVGGGAAVVLGLCLFALYLDRRAQHAIHASQRKLASVVNAISDCALITLTPEGRVASWNAGAARLKGYRESEVLGKPLDTFYTKADRAAHLPELALGAAASQGKFITEGWRQRKDGSTFWAHVTIERIDDAEGQVVGFAKITRDMTRWKQDQDRIRAIEVQRDSALDNMHQGLALFDGEGRLVLSNRRLGQLWGLAPGALAPGMALPAVVALLAQASPEAQRLALCTQLQAAMVPRRDNAVTIECHADFIVSLASRPVAGGGCVITFEDVTEQHSREARIAYLAHHDALTGLANRTSFGHWCEREMAYAGVHEQRFAIIAIDLDGFKAINDTRGHAEGDRAIQQVAQRLLACCQQGEMVARLGGDEFAVGTMFADEGALDAFVARLAGCFAAPMGEAGVQVTASFGVALSPDDGQTHECLLNNADLALYRAKASMQAPICYYDPAMDEAARSRRQMGIDLRHAIERGELYLVFQPQQALADHRLTGYEALLRWQHPTRGAVNPMDFIPVAEESGEIFAIGEWVLREAARAARQWDEGLRVAVNLSPVQLLQPDLVQRIMAILLETGLPPRRLELEITESAIIADKERALHLLRQIKALGIAIAMDDFGTGYASLDTLHSFPFDKIKIDKSFLQNAATSPQAGAIVRAVIALGRNLSIPVLAEGVETPEQAAFLAAEGCQEGQGYLYGRPQPLQPAAAAGLMRQP